MAAIKGWKMYQGKGRCACAGVTVGKILHIITPVTSTSEAAVTYTQDKDQELQLLEQALEQSRQELDALIDKAQAELGAEQAEIFEIHRMMLDDPDICDNIRDTIQNELLTVSCAALKVGEQQAADFAQLDDDYMKARAADIKDVTARIARNARGEQSLVLTEDVVLVADDL